MSFLKTCGSCLNELDTLYFNKKQSSTDGLSGICKTCTSKHRKTWKRKPENPFVKYQRDAKRRRN